MEIKPCPFCGGKAILTEGLKSKDSNWKFEIVCMDINCSASNGIFECRENCIKAWNTRVGDKNEN